GGDGATATEGDASAGRGANPAANPTAKTQAGHARGEFPKVYIRDRPPTGERSEANQGGRARYPGYSYAGAD
ncbi:MAG: hypothetical protein ACREEO_10960, partial [Phenylobacterium sp.]